MRGSAASASRPALERRFFADAASVGIAGGIGLGSSMKAIARNAWHLLPQPVRHGIGQWLFRCHARLMALIDLWGECWYGVDSASRVPGAEAPDSNPNKPLNYYRCYFLRRRLGLGLSDVVADIGSGSGRVLWVFAGSGAKIRGIELGEQAVAKCRDNLRRLRNQNHRIEVILADAGKFVFTDETVIYLF